MIARVALAGLGLTLLASCGGGGGGSDDSFIPYDDPRLDDLQALGDEVQPLDYTQPSTLIGYGTAGYTGLVAFDAAPGVIDSDPDTVDMLGDLRMTVAFNSDSSISGSATNFVSSRGEAYRGTLQLQNALIDRNADVETQYTYIFDLVGPLQADGRPSSDVWLSMGGDFFGNDFLGLDYMAGEGLSNEGQPYSSFCSNAAVSSSCGDIPWAMFGARLTDPPDA